jgi:hypothetical protein
VCAIPVVVWSRTVITEVVIAIVMWPRAKKAGTWAAGTPRARAGRGPMSPSAADSDLDSDRWSATDCQPECGGPTR